MNMTTIEMRTNVLSDFSRTYDVIIMDGYGGEVEFNPCSEEEAIDLTNQLSMSLQKVEIIHDVVYPSPDFSLAV
jgi:hypothetical protein